MPCPQVDDAAAAEETPCTTGHLPGFVQFLAREAPRPAHRTRDAIEQGLAGESTQVVFGEAPLR